MISKRNNGANYDESRETQLMYNSVKILNQSKSKIKRSMIPNIVLKQAINLYKDLKSWQKVCKKLAQEGYLSSNNKLYTASSLSRAVSRYKSNIKAKLNN